MIKSLYIRIVMMFFVAILISLLASAMITGYLYEKSIREQMQNGLITTGQSLIRIFDRVGFENRALVMEDIKDLMNGSSIQIYDPQFNAEKYGAKPGVSIGEDEIRRAQRGDIVRGNTQDGNLFVGLNFKYQGQGYALFIQTDERLQISDSLSGIIITMIAILMVAGSLFFVLEAAFLIQPLRKMTEATRRMARGDFSADLKVRRKDELGVLVQSFDEMRKQLRKLEQMRQDFVSNVSHEIQSPLTSIRGFAKALREEQVSDEARNRYLEIIISESERMSRMSENLLRLASLESTHHPFHPESFRLDEQIRQVAVSFEPQWSAKKITVDLNLPISQIFGDRDQLNQVWINLLGNSIRFTPEGGRIAVSIAQGVQYVSVKIQDTGIGIPLEDQNHIFERFYKADRSRNRLQNGNGLGLAIVKKIVDLHHGYIEVHSQPGMGTELKVILPYHSFKP